MRKEDVDSLWDLGGVFNLRPIHAKEQPQQQGECLVKSAFMIVNS